MRKNTIFILLLLQHNVWVHCKKTKRSAFQLPSGVLLQLSLYKGFSCTNNGYYADTMNFCQIYHVCHSLGKRDGVKVFQQWTFYCNHPLRFNQLTMTCTQFEDAIHCFQAPDFCYLNDKINEGDPQSRFLSEEDVQKGMKTLPRAPEGGGRFGGGSGGDRYGQMDYTRGPDG